MSHVEHMDKAEEQIRQIRVGVLTMSDTRTPETDTSGALIHDLITEAGYTISAYQLVPDDPETILELVLQWSKAACDVIITNGGTGIAPRDQTIEALTPLFDKQLPGFGELFRMRSFQEIGASAMLSRAVAGTLGRIVVFCLPGSTNAVKLALNEFILPQLEHIVWQLRS